MAEEKGTERFYFFPQYRAPFLCAQTTKKLLVINFAFKKKLKNWRGGEIGNSYIDEKRLCRLM